MASEKEEIILEFKVDQGDALTELERTKKSIIGIKQEQAELNKAYKAGNITLDEYVQEQVRMEGILKKQQNSYNTLQKSVTGVKTQLDKLIDSNKQISKDFQNTSKGLNKLGADFSAAAKNIQVGGTSIGDVSTKLAAFANPATAAVGLVTALGAAYARSTLGAKDLDFVQNQLAVSTTLLTNKFAALIGASGEDGEGFFTSLLNGFLFRLSPELQAQAKILTLNQEELEDLGRTEIEIRGKISERLAENQELLSQIASEQTSYNEKVKAGNDIVTNLKTNQTDLKKVLTDQLGIMKIALGFDEHNETLQTAILQKEREINKLVADTTKKIEGQTRANDNLVQSEQKRLAELRQINRESGKSGLSTDTGGQEQILKSAVEESQEGSGTTLVDLENQIQVNGKKYLNNALDTLDKQRTENATVEAGKRFQLQQEYNAATYETAVTSAIMINDAMAGLFKEGSDAQKFFAISSILVSTADAIAKATAAASGVPFPGNLAAIAASVATVLGNIAQAENILSQAGGGGDFYTKGPALLMVGDNPGGVERVTVEPISGKGQTKVSKNGNLVAMAGGGSITTNPGGLITNSLTQDVNMQLMMANMFKQMPTPVIGLEQFNRANDKLIKKQYAVRI